jgi:XTP/dITP diphosphohydrolase
MDIVLASKNQGKIAEIRELLKDMNINILSLYDIEDLPEIVEDGKTLFENAFKKAMLISSYTNKIAIGEDSGLFVDFLGGRPGIYSSRYAGEKATDFENNMKLLRELNNIPVNKRSAKFRTIMVLYIPDNGYKVAEGELEGVIGFKPVGKNGFGYDSLFIIPEYGRSLAELGVDAKNKISHRGKALKKIKEIIKNIAL